MKKMLIAFALMLCLMSLVWGQFEAKPQYQWAVYWQVGDHETFQSFTAPNVRQALHQAEQYQRQQGFVGPVIQVSRPPAP